MPLTADLRAMRERARRRRRRGVRDRRSGDKATIAVRRRVPARRRSSSARRASCGSSVAERLARPRCSREPRDRRRRTTTSTSSSRHRGRKRKRAARVARRRRAGVIVAALAIAAVVVAVATLGFGAGAALSASCDLNALRPVEIGANSFVFAADGSLLGSIPAERNREPVSLARMSAWLPKATVAIEDRRYWQHGGVDYVGIARAAWTDVTARARSSRAARRSRSSSCATSTPASEKTFNRKLKEACLAIKLSQKWSKDQDPRRVPEHRLLRQPRLRRRGRGADVLLQAREPADAAAGGAARRAAAGAVGLRPVPQPAGRARRGATRCCARCSRRARSRSAQYDRGDPLQTR